MMLASALSKDVSSAVDLFARESSVFVRSWEPLPTWARSFLEVGAQMGELGVDSQGAAVLVLVLPTRAFAAALCAAGVVLQQLTLSLKADTESRFALLQALPSGTVVTYYTQTGRLFRGTLIKCLDELVVIKIGTGADITINKKFAHVVEVSALQSTTLPDQASSKAPPESGAFLNALGSRLALTGAALSRLDCVIVGVEAILRSEIQSMRLSFPDLSGEYIEENLQELLRVRRFSKNSSVYRSDVLSVMGGRSKAVKLDPPCVAIFDGAAAFLKRGAIWPDVPKIVVLDRAERYLDDALAEANREYLQRKVEDLSPQPFISGLSASEALVYRARLT